MTMRVHVHMTGDASGVVQAARESQAAVTRVVASTEKLGSSARGAASNVVPLTTANGGLGQSFRELAAGGIQNVSYQIADFAAQVSAGGSPVVALAQQLPQLAAGFGVAGAAIGAVLAVGIPVGAALLGAGDAAETLTDRSDALAGASDRLDVALKAVDRTNRELAEAYGQNARAMREVLEMQAGLAQADFGEKMRAQVDAITGAFGSLDAMISTPSRDALGVSPTELVLRNIETALKSTAPAAQEVLDGINALSNAEGPEAQAYASLELARAMAEAAGGASNLTGETLDLYRALLETAPAGFSAAAGLDAVGASAGGAAGQFRAVAAEARDAALAVAEYQQSRIRAEQQSKARLDQRTAPLAATEDSRNSNERGIFLSYEDRQAIARADAGRARAAGSGRGTDGGGRSAGGGGRSVADEAERGRQAVGNMIAAMQAEIDVMHTADPVQQELIKLRQRMTHATSDQAAEVERLIGVQIAEEAAMDAQIARMDMIRDSGSDAFETVRDKIMEGAKAGEILGSVLSSVGDRLMALGGAGISDILLGKQGEAGGGVLGGFLSSILPFAQGGVVASPTLFGFGGGRVGLMGEAGPEAIMPLSSGMVGARIGGRETRLPLTRLGSGDLGVSVTPFARGGVVTPGPLAWAAGSSSGSGAPVASAGRMRIELALSPDLQARMIEEAGAQADVKIQRGLRSYDKSLPAKVGRIRRDPGYMGGR